MIRLDHPTRDEFDRWFALSAERQAQDRAWVNGTDPKAERVQLGAMIPMLLPNGLDTPNHAFRIARDGTSCELGFVWVGVFPDMPADTRVLFDLFVHEGHRGRGVGHAIVEQMFDLARADGVHTVLLYVRADNSPARALYTSLGFVANSAPDGARDLQMAKTL